MDYFTGAYFCFFSSITFRPPEQTAGNGKYVLRMMKLLPQANTKTPEIHTQLLYMTKLINKQIQSNFK